mgnify:FL=1
MAWKITTLTVAASTVSIHSTAGDHGTIIVSASHTGGTIFGSMNSDGTGPSADLHTGAANVPNTADNYPYLVCDADGTERTFIIAERVKDPS